jgi:PAS domain S-box-containing protein
MKKDRIDHSFKEIAHNLSEGVVLTDAKGQITWTNEAFHHICGYTPEEVVGRTPGQFLQGKLTDADTVRDLRNAVKNGARIRVEIVNYHKDGSPYWASVSITPIKSDRGRLQGFVAIEQDITEQHKRVSSMEEEMAHIYNTLVVSEKDKKEEIQDSLKKPKS